MKSEPLICQRKEDIAQHSGKRCTVTGTYEQVDVRMRRTEPPVYAGHASVRLTDGTRVMLEPSWSPAAIRPPAERERLAGQTVEVQGTVFARAPSPAEEVAQLTGPCVSPVESVRSVVGK